MNTHEQRLDQIRETARAGGDITGPGVRPRGGPIPIRPGYYGEPVVRPPVWTWEIPVYFFVGGMGGMSAVIAAAAAASHHVDVARTAMLLAVFAAFASPVLLIMDLGRPARFLNMLRVFKCQSTMSVGAWVLVFFSTVSVPAFLALEAHARGLFAGAMDSLIRIAGGILLIGSALFGSVLATYTGVLIGATSVPAWFTHRKLLPIHFGTAALGSAAAVLELLGHRIMPLNAIGLIAAGMETALALALLFNRHGAADRAVHEWPSGLLVQSAEVLTGPLALILRTCGLIPLAAASFAIGALISRFGWLSAGKVSGADPEAVFAAERNSAF